MGSSDSGLTSERLAEIESRVIEASYPRYDYPYSTDAKRDMSDLLAEVERLRAALAAAEAREAALAAVVRQIVRPPEGVELLPVYVRPEAYRQARAVLASAEAHEQGETFVCPGCDGRWRKDQLGPTPDILRCPNCGEFCEPEPGEA